MSDDTALKALEAKVDALTRQLGILEDTNEIKSLQYKYGYYIDKCLYDEAVDLFSDDAELRFLNGIYRGREGARRLYCTWFREYFTHGHNGPIPGFLLDHLLLQDIVDVAPDRQTAKGRFRCMMQGGSHRSKTDPIPGLPDQFWEGGIYENEYVREGGIWKIKLLNYNMLWQANYREGWTDSETHLMPLDKIFPEDPRGPDVLAEMPPAAWPATRVVPFHYPHPVTGKFWEPK
jgi:hypothetical protein